MPRDLIPADVRGHIERSARDIEAMHERVSSEQQRPRDAYTPPKPPPEGLDPVKWRHLSRKDRRALLRYHAKQMRAR